MPETLTIIGILIFVLGVAALLSLSVWYKTLNNQQKKDKKNLFDKLWWTFISMIGIGALIWFYSVVIKAGHSAGHGFSKFRM